MLNLKASVWLWMCLCCSSPSFCKEDEISMSFAGSPHCCFVFIDFLLTVYVRVWAFVLQSVSSLLVCISPQWMVCLCVSHRNGWFAYVYFTPVNGLLVSHPSGCSCVYLTPVGVLVCISPQWVFLCISHPSGQFTCVYLTPVGSLLVCISPQWAFLCVSPSSG